jgi:hypothetical protein
LVFILLYQLFFDGGGGFLKKVLDPAIDIPGELFQGVSTRPCAFCGGGIAEKAAPRVLPDVGPMIRVSFLIVYIQVEDTAERVIFLDGKADFFQEAGVPGGYHKKHFPAASPIFDTAVKDFHTSFLQGGGKGGFAAFVNPLVEGGVLFCSGDIEGKYNYGPPVLFLQPEPRLVPAFPPGKNSPHRRH